MSELPTLPRAEEILADVESVRVALGLNRHPQRDEYLDHPARKFSKRQISETFGSWTRMLLGAAGDYAARGKRDKQQLRERYYQHLLAEVERFRNEQIVHPPARSLIVLGDLHAPFMHQDYPAFAIAVAEKYESDRACCVGDEVDHHSISFHDHDPDLLSPGPELEAAIRQLEPLYAAFPVLDLADSNHGSLVFRKGKHHGLPRQVISPYHEQLRCPSTWRWSSKIVVALSDGSEVDIHHSYGANVLAQSKKRGRSLIQGHHHTEAGVQWWGSDTGGERFAAFTGCGIDDVALAFAYNKNQVERPRLGLVVVLQGVARWIPMQLDQRRRWTGIVP